MVFLVVVVVVVYVDNAKTLIIMHMKACKKKGIIQPAFL